MGFEGKVIPDIEVNSGKETVLIPVQSLTK
jgi:hypothetical protein